ncbi:MarR family winged helix-turn-helix transcriptional regulator [Pseudonocardia asaccharolytica]|uniref:MarR family transcriptional regulator n=1 Tax=Pseudonocardia asaccharolytica DSM 44247 = NBRC 16224 TaxID=1123024 RepID=A0A511D8T6_9PSEU|nr:MarR family transcriptional regulator [Pseudonocardia asaccharolytica]GEL21017.1 MarR family transcriptional regulator [Pseudonocardia asaccharolytica DSM 44247 = NBRC 16224]
MPRRQDLAREITASLARRHSTATVLFHHALAERLGLGPADHKCLDLLHERGPMTGSELAALTGLTTGAITGVVARLERSGRLRREPHPRDRRKQLLYPTNSAVEEIQDLFATLPAGHDALLEGFTGAEVAAIHTFLTRATDLLYRRVAALRSHTVLPTAPSGRPAERTSP